jgi:mRNA interferase RelE/StbE
LSDYGISFRPSAEKELGALPVAIRTRIGRAIGELALDPRPRGARQLRVTGEHRIRVGDYRVLYVIDDDAAHVRIVKVGHRRDVYR